MSPDSQTQWKEFFQDRPDKAVAIPVMFAGYVHTTLAVKKLECSPHRIHGATSGTPSSRQLHAFQLLYHTFSIYSVTFYSKVYPASVSSIHIKLEEDDKEGVNFTPGFLDE
jgi:alcohol oxidase